MIAAPAALLERVRHAHQAGVDVYRACALCDHGPRRNGQPGCCTLDGRRPVPVNAARGRDGRCGPEARHMRIDGWDLS
ncbi:MAG: hypothetical protein RJA36_477 [Pseudomonadota bacterium]